MSGRKGRAAVSCPLCGHLDFLCHELDPEGRVCRGLVEALQEGRISAREFAERVVREFGPDRVAEALSALAKALGGEGRGGQEG